MSAYVVYRRAINNWKSGLSHAHDNYLLAASKEYLEATNDWPMVRDILFEMGKTRKEILSWFSSQDCPDFREAVNDGWGWGKKFAEVD